MYYWDQVEYYNVLGRDKRKFLWSWVSKKSLLFLVNIISEIQVEEPSYFFFIKNNFLLLWDTFTLLEKFWRISLYVTGDAVAKLYVT